MNPFTYDISRNIIIGIHGGSLPEEAQDAPPSTDPLGEITLLFNTFSAGVLNSMNLPGIPEFRFD